MNKDRGSLVTNSTEFLDRGKQRFDVTKAIQNLDSDTFAEIVQEKDKNPSFTRAYGVLRKRKENFMLTMNPDYTDKVESETESEDEMKANIHEMMYRSNVQTKSLYCWEASSFAMSESVRLESQQSFIEDTIGDVTDRAGLLDAKDKDKEKGPPSSEPEETEDKDVVLLKKRITSNLEK